VKPRWETGVPHNQAADAARGRSGCSSGLKQRGMLKSWSWKDWLWSGRQQELHLADKVKRIAGLAVIALSANSAIQACPW
jgi:hypothetical protein